MTVRLIDGYAPADEDKPLASYAALTVAYHLAVAAFLVDQRRRGRTAPERIGAGDLVLLALATQKLSRLLAKDRVTSFLRSPFTRYTGEGGPGEVSEEPRGSGLRRAIGELLVCPHCTSLWIGTGLVAGFLRRPKETRLLASAAAVIGVSDFVNQGWVALEGRA